MISVGIRRANRRSWVEARGKPQKTAIATAATVLANSFPGDKRGLFIGQILPLHSAPTLPKRALEGEREEKDGSKEYEGHETSCDETGTIASDEFRHAVSSVVLANKRGNAARGSAGREGGSLAQASRVRRGRSPLLNVENFR